MFFDPIGFCLITEHTRYTMLVLNILVFVSAFYFFVYYGLVENLLFQILVYHLKYHFFIPAYAIKDISNCSFFHNYSALSAISLMYLFGTTVCAYHNSI